MKVIVQNGVHHPLSRRDVEAMIPQFPPGWKREVTSILLCGEHAEEIRTSFHKKEGVLCIYFPMKARMPPSKHDLITQAVLALAIIAERGDLPDRISASSRQRLLQQEQDVLKSWYKKAASNADS